MGIGKLEKCFGSFQTLTALQTVRAQPLFHFVIVAIIFLINVDVVLRYNTYKKLAKNQTTSKQYPDAEHLLFEIY